MFKKDNRLSRVEFLKYYKEGKKHNFPHLTVVKNTFVKNKIAVVVGKKVSKSAVRRNLLKRRVYSNIKNFLLENKKNKYIIIIILKPSYNNLSRKEADKIIIDNLSETITK